MAVASGLRSMRSNKPFPMTACRNSCLAAVWLVVLTSFAAYGQTEPAAPSTATGAPQPLAGDEAPPPNLQAPTEFKPGILGTSTQTGVTTHDLGIVDGAPEGTLDDSN